MSLADIKLVESDFLPPGTVLVFNGKPFLREPPVLAYEDWIEKRDFDARLAMKVHMAYGAKIVTPLATYVTALYSEPWMTRHERYWAGLRYFLAFPLRWPE